MGQLDIYSEELFSFSETFLILRGALFLQGHNCLTLAPPLGLGETVWYIIYWAIEKAYTGNKNVNVSITCYYSQRS